MTLAADNAHAGARQLRSGAVDQEKVRTDSGLAFGGFTESGTRRQGRGEGIVSFLETKTVIHEDVPTGHAP